MDTQHGQHSIIRKFKRIDFGARIGAYSNGSYQFGQGVRISEGGMLLRFSVLHPIGSVLELNFNLTRDVFVIVRAQVKYVLPETPNRPGLVPVGVEFIDLKPQFRTAIQSYVKVHSR